jgi:hypothetical protein
MDCATGTNAGCIQFEPLPNESKLLNQSLAIDVAHLFVGPRALPEKEKIHAHFYAVDRYQPEKELKAHLAHLSINMDMANATQGVVLLAWTEIKGLVYPLFGVYLATKQVNGCVTNGVWMLKEMLKTSSRSELLSVIQDALQVRVQRIRSEEARSGLHSLPLSCWFEWTPSSRYGRSCSKALSTMPAPSLGSRECMGSADTYTTAVTTESMSDGGDTNVSADLTTEEGCLPWPGFARSSWWPWSERSKAAA